ncbi:MAG: hypothetical protein ABI380_09515 [Edaphobacter sp.]
MIYLLALISIMVPLLILQVRWAYRRRQLMAGSWETVIERIRPVNLDGLRTIAECYLQPDKNQLSIEPSEMWAIVGGLQGISRLQANAAAMLDLAVFAERWDDVQGRVVSEMIRRDAVRLNNAVRRLELAYFFQFAFIRAPFYIQEAAATYYLIRSRLLGLYENCHAGLYPRLAEAL